MDFYKNIKIDLRKYGISEQSVIVEEHEKSSKLCLFREKFNLQNLKEQIIPERSLPVHHQG